MLWMSTGTRQGAGSSHPHSSRQVEATPQPQRACLGLAPSHTGRARELSWGQRSNLGSFVIPSHKSMLLLPKPRVVVGEGSHRLLGTRWSPPPSPAPPSLANSQPPAPRRAVLHPDGSEFSHHCCPGQLAMSHLVFAAPSREHSSIHSFIHQLSLSTCWVPHMALARTPGPSHPVSDQQGRQIINTCRKKSSQTGSNARKGKNEDRIM